MPINHFIFKNHLVIAPPADFDAHWVDQIRTELDALVSSNEKDVVFDLSDVTFLDSSGIGAMVFTFKNLKIQGKSMQLVGISGQPERLIRLLRIDRVLNCNESLKALTDGTTHPESRSA